MRSVAVSTGYPAFADDPSSADMVAPAFRDPGLAPAESEIPTSDNRQLFESGYSPRTQPHLFTRWLSHIRGLSTAAGLDAQFADPAPPHYHTPTTDDDFDSFTHYKVGEARAMSLLQAKIMTQAQQVQDDAQAATRRNLVGSGDRSEKIRTYNFPDSRVTDHRINLTLHRLAQTMAGDLSPIVDHLVQEYQADLLSALSSDTDD